MNRLLYVLSDKKIPFACVALFGLTLNVVFSVADPFVMKVLIDEGLIQQNFGRFAVFASLVVLFGVGIRGISLVYELICQRLKNTLTESITLRMLNAYFRIPYAEITQYDSGYFISRLYDEPARVAHGVVTTVTGLLVSAVTFAAALCISVYLTWKITLFLCFVVPALYYLANRFRPMIKSASERESEEEAKLREVLGKTVDSYKTVRVFALFPSVSERVHSHLRSYLDVFYLRVRTSQSYQTLSRVWLSFVEALVLVAAGWEVVAGNLTIGGLFAFMTAFWKIVGMATAVVNQIPELSRLSACIDRLAQFESLARPEDRLASQNIELENVAFRYKATNVFDRLNLRIESNERVLVAGPNGSGKTTLSHLITGFLEPSEGAVRAPNMQRISAMLSPFYFAPGNLKDNVDYGRLQGDKAAQFWELVRAFGLERKIEADLSELSEGEKKKCQIIMTLLKDADIYIFDEPLANIDVGSCDSVVQTQLEYTRGKTLISIMHGAAKYHHSFDRIVMLGA
jgi:ABC-type multidrug transport system fused ATPase/permease subunit